jgi:uncharacterized damage-inducible protein DinB
MIKEFINQSVLRINENLSRIDHCLSQLSDEEVWQKPNESTNSISNLILHLSGNITQYIISSLGGAEDNRNRDLEFAATGGYTVAQLSDKINSTIKTAVDVITNASEPELLRNRIVQGFNLSGIGIIVHVTEHLSYHTGQIALLTKLIKNKDLGFYNNVDLNVKNS